MKPLKKNLLCVILVLALCLSTVPVFADSAAAVDRAAVVEALYALEGEPVVIQTVVFDDAAGNAVTWAYGAGIINGDGRGTFHGGRAVTRAELSAMLYRYAQSKGLGFTGLWAFPLDCPDAADVPEWAYEATAWCVMKGILTTDDTGRLAPASTVTQSEFRAVLARLADETMLSLWTDAAPAKTALTTYMTAITDPNSPDFIPVTDRIAVFDLDGTLMCETYPRCFEYMVFVDYALNNPDYTPTAEVKAVAQEIMDTRWQEKPSGISTRQAAAAAIAYKGMTPAELEAYVTDFMSSDAEGFTGLKRGEAFYIPMVEMVKFLEANDFTVYIVTATERNIVRALVKNALGIPPAHVIGTEYGYTATGQGETADGDYTFQPSDKVVFDGNYYGENAKMSKVDAIVREIGQQPVLAFGNSSGDIAMCEYVVTNNPYSALSYIVLADDETREWGDAEDAKAKIADYTALGIGTISMRDDFKTIYGNGVEKDTGAPNR